MSGVLALLLTVAGVLVGPLAAATPSPSPPGPAASTQSDTVPQGVLDWFAEQGPQAASELDGQDLALGPARQVATWDEDFLAGDQSREPAQVLEEWVAPVVDQSPSPAEPRGVVHVDAAGAAPQLLAVTADVEFAAALAGSPANATYVYDDDVEGWFGTLDGEVWPASEGALTVLQGTLPADVFREFLAVWRGESVATPAPAPAEEPAGSLSPLIPISVIVVVGAVVAWLLVRQYRRADSRIAAVVRASMTPPREGRGSGRKPAEREDYSG